MTKSIYLAGGCFWGTEHLFSLVGGVTSTTVGYANSLIPSPTYQQVCTGLTGAAESVRASREARESSAGRASARTIPASPCSLSRQCIGRRE